MNDKLKILEISVKKISTDKNFMSFVLHKYLDMENKSEQDLLGMLHCSLEDYYKLALCKVPNTTAKDFTEKLKILSDYTHASLFELNKIIKRVDSITHLASASNNTYLMAARDKKTDNTKD